MRTSTRAATRAAPGRRYCHVRVADGVQVHRTIVDLVEGEVLPGTDVAPGQFWRGLAELQDEFGARNAALLDKRVALQKAITDYHEAHKGQPWDAAGYKALLKEIGYYSDMPEAVAMATSNMDVEMTDIPAPQLVCPVDNARYIVNAANARWGSLLDALYGTDVIPGSIPKGGYCPKRGAVVFSEVHRILDDVFPLTDGSWGTVSNIARDNATGALRLTLGARGATTLSDDAAFVGFRTAGNGGGALASVLLRHNGLHMELVVDREHAVGATHPAGLCDVQVESALSVLADAEDSACTVDAADKAVAYRNWNGLMRGSIAVPVAKGDLSFERKLNTPRTWSAARDAAGAAVTLPGRAVLMCRNVGIHMYTDIVQTDVAKETPEQFLDAMVTGASGKYDVTQGGGNSRGGSVYIVKPKMHGADEVQYVCEMFTRVEEILGMGRNTLKMGIMDEERRTSLNLKRALHAARERAFFINTGFLDRVGDEIHTSMAAGPMLPKDEIRSAPFLAAYEASNVDRGLETGLVGRGQIGKGMWAAPDNMAEMMEKKVGHLKAGATVSWCPSPTAATLHALHYHAVDVRRVQDDLRADVQDRNDTLLQPPLLNRELTLADIQAELECNAQSLLGYVVRWVGQGVGCSKVPDTNNVALMEDRATLRISSQHIANWLHHGCVTEAQVIDTLKKMALVVDAQNAGDAGYKVMGPNFDTVEFQAALDLIFKGVETTNGYTEYVLSHYRRERKALDAHGPGYTVVPYVAAGSRAAQA